MSVNIGLLVGLGFGAVVVVILAAVVWTMITEPVEDVDDDPNDFYG